MGKYTREKATIQFTSEAKDKALYNVLQNRLNALNETSKTVSKDYEALGKNWMDTNTSNAYAKRSNDYYSEVDSTKKYLQDNANDFKKILGRENYDKVYSDLDNVLKGKAKANDYISNVVKIYSQYENAEAYDKAKREYGYSTKYQGKTYDDISKYLASDDYKTMRRRGLVSDEENTWLKNYKINAATSDQIQAQIDALGGSAEQIKNKIHNLNLDLDDLQLKYREGKISEQDYKAKAKDVQKQIDTAESNMEQLPLLLTTKAKKKQLEEFSKKWEGELSNFDKEITVPDNGALGKILVGEDYTGEETWGRGKFGQEMKPQDVSDYETYLPHLDEDQKRQIYFLSKEYGKEKAKEYFNDLITVKLDQKYNQQIIADAAAFTGDNGWAALGGSIGSVATSLGSGIETIGNWLTGNTDRRSTLSSVTTGLREGTKTHWDGTWGEEAWDFLYDTGMSAADSLAAAGLSAAVPFSGEILLGASAAASTYNEMLDRGVSGGDAILASVAAGAAESLFEHVSLGKILDAGDITKGFTKAGVKQAVKKTGTDILVNLSEEAATDIANIVTDSLINGDLSSYAVAAQQYYMQGYSAEEAKKMAANDLAKQVALAGLSGALMGFGFGAGGSVVGLSNSSIKNSKAGNAVLNTENGIATLKTIASQKGDAEVKSAAEKLTENSKPSEVGYVFNRLYEQSLENTINQLTHALTQNGATKGGVNSAKGFADQIVKTALAPKSEDKRAKERTLRVNNITKDVYAGFADEGKYGADTLLKLNELTSFKTKTNEQIAEGINRDITKNRAMAEYAKPAVAEAYESNRPAFGTNELPAEVRGNLENMMAGKPSAVAQQPNEGNIQQRPAPQKAAQKKITPVGEKIVKAFGKANGVNVVFTDELVDGVGNGKFDTDKTIYISRYSNNPIKVVIKHEFSHSTEKSKLYPKFQKYVFEDSKAFQTWLKNKGYASWKEAVKNEVSKYEAYGVEYKNPYAVAKADVIANFVSETLFNEDGTDINGEITENFLQELKQADRTLWQRFVDFIKSIFARIKEQDANNKDIIKLEQKFLRLVETSRQERAKGEQGEAEQGQYSLATTANNIPVVVVNDDITKNTQNNKELISVVKRSLGKFKRVPIKGQSIHFLRDTKREYTNSKYTQWLKKNNVQTYKDKMRLAGHTQDIVYATTEYINEGLNHPRKDNIVDFARGNILIDVSGRKYSAEVVIGFTKSGICELYDIVEMTPTQFEYKKEATSEAMDSKTESNRSDVTSVYNSIPNSTENVKGQYSLPDLDANYLKAVESGDMKTAQKMVDEAAKEAGYDSPILYHGTRSFGFTQFDLEKMDDKRSIFLTDNKKIASTYSGVMGARNISSSKEVAALSPQDLVNEFNAYDEQFGNDTTLGKGEYQLYNFKKFNKLLNDINSGIKNLTKKVDEQIKIYADKMAIDFDEKDSKIHSQLVKLSESLKKYDYDNLSTPIYMLLHHSEVFDRSPKIAKLESNIRLMNKLKNMDLSEGVIASEHLGGYDIEVMSIDTARMELGNKYKQGNMSLVAKLGKSLVIDGKNQNWNDIRNWSESAYINPDDVYIEKSGNFFCLFNKSNNVEIEDGAVNINENTEKMLSNGTLLDFMVRKADSFMTYKTENLNTTRDISLWAKSNGYDSVTIKNIIDNGGWNSNVSFLETADIYIIFNPNNVKSADPVTYDDNGNVIPLSQRFNKEETDIRYSLPDIPDTAKGKSKDELSAMVDSGEITPTQALNALADQFGAIPKGENAKADVVVPSRVSKDKNVMRWVRTAAESGHLDNGMLNDQRKQILKGALSYKVISDKAAVSKADDAIREDFAGAVQKWEDIINSGKQMTKFDIALGERLLQQAAENGQASDVMKYTAELAELGTRMGQNIQALRLLKKMTGIGKLYYIQRTVNSLNKDIEQKYKGKKQPVKIDADLAKILAESKNATEAESVEADMLKDIADQMPSTLLDKWNAWRYLAMLGNPRTHIRNIVGNAVFVPAIRIKDGLSYAGERFVPKEKRTKVFGLLKPEYRDFAKNDFKEIKDILTGDGKMNPSDKIRDQQKIFKTKALEILRNKNTAAMEAEDSIFLQLHYVRAFGSTLQARGIDLKNVTEEQLNSARLYALKEAKKATYRDASAVAEALNRFQYSKNKSVRAFGMLVEGILPFKKTPINILKRGVEYSPVGLLNSLSKGVYDLKKGKITADEFIDGISAGLTGTGIMALGMLLQSLGIIVGGLDYDDEDALERMSGAQPYSIQVGDISYTIDWMAPAVLPFLVGAEVEKFLESDNERDPIGFVVDALAAIGEPLTELSMLSGLNDAIESVAYSDNKLTDMLTSAATSYLSQGLPTAFGQVARIFDDTRRINYIDKNSSVPKSIQTAYQKAIGKIPGLENSKVPYIDAWGRTEVSDSALLRTFENLVSPGYVSKITDDKVNNELAKIYTETGEGGVIPKRASNSIQVDGVTKNLTADEYVQYATDKGQYSRQYVESLISHPIYSSLDDASKAEIISDLYSYANAKAKSNVSDYDYTTVSTYKTAAKLEAAGIDPVSYYIAVNATSVENADTDGSGTVSKKEKQKALRNAGFNSKDINTIININKKK